MAQILCTFVSIYVERKQRRQRDAKCSGKGNKILFSLICRNKKIDVSMMYRTFVVADGCRVFNNFIETNWRMH